MNKAHAALSYLPADDREFWVKIGMAIKSEFAEDGFDMWNQWSQGADSYNEKSARAVWRSISPDGKIRIGTLYHEAAARGWRDSGEHRGPLTAQELEEKRKAAIARAAAISADEERKERGYWKAAELSQTLIETCELATHYYLNAKGLPDAIGLVADGVLIVPMRNLKTNQLQGAQTIEWIPEERTWEKKMLPGMRAKGAVLRLGSPVAPETILCEGYATGLSIELAIKRLRLNASVLICFSDSNMVHVAEMVEGKAYVFADNDKSQAGEKAAQKTGLPYVMSNVLGEDANDLHSRAGLMALCKKVMDVRINWRVAA